MSTNELIFQLLSFSPGPFWLILLFAPRHQLAMQAFDLYLFILSALFAVLTIPVVPELLPVIASPTLQSIQAFLATERGTIGVWNHMILGDLWIGRWVVHDACKHNVSAFVRVPILFAVLFFGPLGLFFYLLYRMVVLKKFWLVTAQ